METDRGSQEGKEWMETLRELTKNNWDEEEIFLGNACRAALTEIETQGKEIDDSKRYAGILNRTLNDREDEIARLTTLNASFNDQNVSLTEEITTIKRLHEEALNEGDMMAERILMAEAERDDLCRRFDGLMEAAENVADHYPDFAHVDKLKDAIAIARGEKGE